MSLYKRKDSPCYWIKLSVNGRRIQRSTGTTDRKKAQEYHDKLKVQLWEESRLGIKKQYTWNEAVVKWLKETEHKASRKEDIMHLRLLDKYLDGVVLSTINREKLDRIRDGRKTEAVSNASVNRMMAVVRAILRRACFEWEWLDRAPKVPMFREEKRRVRWLTQEEAKRLLSELPLHLRDMAYFSLETGLRQGNVKGLEWKQVDLTRRCAWIHPDQAKARKAIPVPLSDGAIAVIREQIGKHLQYVFTYRGKPITQVNTKAWKGALERAGIEDFRWHDLRHTWASWHIQDGTPMHVLQEMGGWSCAEMVRRYAHLSSEHLAEYANRRATIQLR